MAEFDYPRTDDPVFPQTANPPVTWPETTYFVNWLDGLTIRPGDNVYPNYVIFYRTWCPVCGRRFESAIKWILREDISGHSAFTCHPESWAAVPGDD